MFEVIQRILLRAKPSSELYTSAIDQGAKLLGIDREVVIAQAFQELSLSKTPTVAMKTSSKAVPRLCGILLHRFARYDSRES